MMGMTRKDNTMDRREFTLRSALGAAATLGLAPLARAQAGAPVEGRDYVKLAQPIAMPAGSKIDVVEFFGYWCPHCNAFEPSLEAWIKTLPPDVAFRRVPVAFGAAHEPYQRIYYALEALNMVEQVHRKVFAAIHVSKQRLDKEADILALMTANGVDGAKFSDAFKSFSVQTKLRQARQLADAYKIDGVPTLGVHGKFFTSPSLTNSQERALAVANQLIQRARAG
jgi:protein dithiol oxidoreductase (disulfide-forming)